MAIVNVARAQSPRPRPSVLINHLIRYAPIASTPPTASRPLVVSRAAVDEAVRRSRTLRKALTTAPPIILTPPLRVTQHIRIQHNEHTDDVRTRVHEQQVAKLVNELSRKGELAGTINDPSLGYNAANPSQWVTGTPTTVKGAIDTLVGQSYSGAYSVAVSANWDIPYPTTVISALDTLAARVQAVEDTPPGSASIEETTIATPIPSTPGGVLQFTPDSPYAILAANVAQNYHGPLFKMTPPVDGDFSWINQASSTVSTTHGGVYLASPANAADSWSFRVKTCPATPYTLVAYVMPLMMNVNNAGVALVLRKASDGTWIGFQQYCVSPDLYLSVGHGTNAGPAITVDDLGSVIIPQFYPWMRISDDGANRTFWVSMDGNNWLQVYTQAHATPLVPDQIGFGVEARNATYGIGLGVLSWVQS